MTLEFLFFINIVLISRLFFTFGDKPVTRKQLIITSVILIPGFIFYEISIASFLLIILLLAVNIISGRIEKKNIKLNEVRFFSLIIQIILLSIFFSEQINIPFNHAFINFISSFKQYFVLFNLAENINWLKIHLFILGLLILTNEVNIVLRILLNLFNIKPDGKLKDSSKELNAGRIIGILERIIIFILILNHEYAAIGLVLAAKGFTRFKELDNREFAEYVLVGTLLSALTAMMAGQMILFLI